MFQRKMLKCVAVVLVICLMCCTLMACATKLSGTYTSKDGLIKQSFTFMEDDRVKVSAFGINVEGTYKIEDDEITITYSLLNLSYNMTKSFEKSGQSIFVDGVEFVKE